MYRRVAAAAAGILAVIVAATFRAAPAVATPPTALQHNLSALWTAVLETPTPQNPYLGDGCFHLGHTLAPFGASGVPGCTAKAGTRLFVIGGSVECSSFDGDHGSYGTSNKELRRCANESDLQTAPTVTVDGRPLYVASVQTPVLRIVLPADNIFGLPEGASGRSVAHGWVVLVHPLAVGTHVVHIETADHSVSITTEIRILPRCEFRLAA